MAATLYPYLTGLIETLTEGLGLEYPILAYANLEQVTIQGTPSVFLIPDDAQVLQTISGIRNIASLRISQDWTVLTVLRDASDQKVTEPLLTQLGEWQARILTLLMGNVLTLGGPIKILEFPKAESIEGGAIAGKLRFQTQFVFTVE